MLLSLNTSAHMWIFGHWLIWAILRRRIWAGVLYRGHDEHVCSYTTYGCRNTNKMLLLNYHKEHGNERLIFKINIARYILKRNLVAFAGISDLANN